MDKQRICFIILGNLYYQFLREDNIKFEGPDVQTIALSEELKKNLMFILFHTQKKEICFRQQ
jgi:hypothetical protein